MMLQRALTALAVAAGICICSTAAQAAAVNYSFTGVIDTDDNTLPSNFQKGTTFSGTFSVDPTVVPTSPNGDQFVYEALLSFSVDFGGYVATKTGNPGEEVQVDIHGGPSNVTDRYDAAARGVTGGDINGFTIGSIVSLVLFSDVGDTILPGFTDANAKLPLPTDLSGFDLTKSGFFFSLESTVTTEANTVSPQDGTPVSGHLTALDATPIPEPGSMVLLGIGMTICGSAWLHRRRVVEA
jgi:hypothetical protein